VAAGRAVSWLPAVLVLGGLILLHELGHFLAARACGVAVEEFSLGLGPRLAGVRYGGTLYALRLVPVLGYVRMAGMYPPAEDGEPAGRPETAPGGDFWAKPLWQRMAIIAAGPVTNFLVALVLYTLVFGVVGLPAAPTMRIRAVERGMPAALAGIRPGDEIVAVNKLPVHSWQELHDAIVRAAAEDPGAPLQLEVARGSQVQTVSVAPVRTPQGPLIGVVPQMRTERLAPLPALGAGAAQTVLAVYQSLAAIATLVGDAVLRRPAGAQLMGPIGIGAQIGQATQAGPAVLLLLAALLSANLGLLNLLPVPALDGGRLAFLCLEGLRGGRPIDPAKEGLIHFIGLAVLMAGIVLVSMHDLAQLG
jgi:regulator of sigma E protease